MHYSEGGFFFPGWEGRGINTGKDYSTVPGTVRYPVPGYWAHRGLVQGLLNLDTGSCTDDQSLSKHLMTWMSQTITHSSSCYRETLTWRSMSNPSATLRLSAGPRVNDSMPSCGLWTTVSLLAEDHRVSHLEPGTSTADTIPVMSRGCARSTERLQKKLQPRFPIALTSTHSALTSAFVSWSAF